MKKLKKLWPLFLSLTILVILIILIANQPKTILFYGDVCPHCQNVEDYLEKNPSTVKFRHLEVYRNRQNSVLMESKAKLCGLETDSVGVPFLFDGKNCLVGDQDIINWFQQQ